MASRTPEKERRRLTDENLKRYALKPVAAMLINAAKKESKVTYGRVARMLAKEHEFRNRHRRVHVAAYWMMKAILEKYQDAPPPLHVLMVNQKSGLPGEGAIAVYEQMDEYMYLVDEYRHLTNMDMKREYWQYITDKATEDVYSRSARYWDKLFNEVFGGSLPEPTEQESTEEDGISYDRNGEGKNHEALRLWVRDNPEEIDDEFAGIEAETEVVLDSADRVDVVYYGKKIVALEVKSKDSNDDDLKRGVFQCIKYRAVLSAMDNRSNPPVEAILVTQRKLPGDIAAIAKHNKVRLVVVSSDI